MDGQENPLEGMRGEEHDILKLIGTKGEGFEIVACEGQGSTDYYPAVDDDGSEKGFFEWASPDEYFAHKVRKTRLTVRYTIIGNPISAEECIMEMVGCNAMAVGPHTLDVYYLTDNPYASRKL